MSDEGERICPLCAEEMDLTDQQLKPCKCGYEICVWCWHHIMDMAEKDQTDGRCPACRTAYNKAKIVGMTANCERLVAELNMERKMKSQKAKSKTSEGRKQLSSVRVIQRNLVYVVGLPLNLAEEDLLRRREYFGQYGKVLKVSISRTAAGAIQHFANNTCSVYITYSKEEEAVRCIQSVHGFVLDGKSLRACFGTTKYCHAWLRNVPCSNPDCLYLHEVGSQEDSFIKDEIVSACTRSRVQQITGATNSIQRRSGNVLPPAADEYYINSSASSGKPISKSSSNSSASCVSGSPPNSSSGRFVALPPAASWGMSASNNQSPSTSLACSNVHLKQKPETGGCSMEFSKAVAGTTQVPLLHGEVGKNFISNVEGQTILHEGQEEPLKTDGQYEGTDHQTTASGAPASQELPAASIVNSQLQSAPSSEDKDICTNVEPNITNSLGFSGQSYSAGPDKVMNVSANGNIQSLCSEMAALNFDRHIGAEPSGHARPNSSLSDNTSVTSPRNQGLQQCFPEKVGEPSTSIALTKALASTDDIHTKREQSDLRSDFLTRESGWRSDSQTQVPMTDLQVAPPEVEKDLQYFEDQRLKDPELVTSYFPNPSHSFHRSGHSGLHSHQQNEPFGSTRFNCPHVLDNNVNKGLLPHPSGVPMVPNGDPEDIISNSLDLDRAVEHSYLFPSEGKRNHSGRFEVEATNSNQNVATDMLGESNIVSNILSIDFDAWDEMLTSPRNLAKFLGETDRRQGSLKSSNSWKAQNSSQSRFSFARYDEPKNQVSNVKTSLSNIGRVLKDDRSTHDFAENKFFNFDKFGDCNGFSAFNIEEPNNFTSGYSHLSPNKLSASRTHVSAPPGFSVPNRVPPTGFASHDRTEPTFDSMSGHHLLGASTLLRNPYQAPPAGNIGGTGDIEFMDPAILAVGKGRLPGGLNNTANLDMRSNFSSQLSAFENEAGLQLLMQRSLSPLQNQRFADMGESFASFDAYRVPPRMMEQTLACNLSPFSQISLQQPRTSLMSNGQWDGWNEVQSGSDRSMAELLRSERLGLNKFYGGYEDSKFRMNNSGDLYNRTYGI